MKQSIAILQNYVQTNQEAFLEYPLETIKDLIRINGPNWRQDEVIEILWEKVLPLQGHEDVVIREKSESVIKVMLENKRYGSGNKGQWEVKEKKGLENYEKYLQLTGTKKDPRVGEHVKNNKTGSNHSRYD